ncbi:hypothetical protein OXX69_008048, partial [Metschnikowia pulcherrima]
MRLTLATSLAILGAAQAIPTFPGNAQAVLANLAPETEAQGEASSWFPWPPWTKPEIDTEKLQESITADALRSRAETLYNIS